MSVSSEKVGFLLLVSLLFTVFGTTASTADAQGSALLMEPAGPFFGNLLKDYDRLKRPGPANEPTVVTLSLHIAQIEEIDSYTQTMTFNAIMRYSFLDDRVKHVFPKAVTTTDLRTIQYLWEPDVIIENAQEVAFHFFPASHAFMEIEPNGRVTFSRRFQLKVYCEANLRSFPMDTVTCPVVFSTYGSTVDTIHLKAGVGPDEAKKRFTIAKASTAAPVGYQLQRLAVTEEEGYSEGSGGTVSFVKVHVELQRLRGGFAATIFLPCFGLITLSYLSLYLHSARDGLGTKLIFNAVLLGITYYLSNSVHVAIPRISALTAMDYFVGTTCFILFWVMAASVFSEMFNQPDAKLPFISLPADIWASRVDMGTKLGIPAFYAVFQLIFWITYLS